MKTFEKEALSQLIQQLTGANSDVVLSSHAIATKVEQHYTSLGYRHLEDYLKHLNQDLEERDRLVSLLTIHTTAWFRENPHFVKFQEILLQKVDAGKVRIWSAACSTGEEVYSFALILEEMRRVHPGFEYEILGTDIDSVSLKTAQKAIYPKSQISTGLLRYERHLLMGSGPTKDFFTFSPEIRKRCRFEKQDLRAVPFAEEFDLVICRNVLIYFRDELLGEVLQNVVRHFER